MGLAIGRAAIGVPLSTDVPRSDKEKAHRLCGLSTALAIIVGLLIGISELIVVLIADVSADLFLAGVLIAIATPLILVQDSWRFSAVAFRRPERALLSDGVWLLVGLLAMAWNALTHRELTPWGAVGVWVAGAVLAFVLLSRAAGSVWPHFSQVPLALRQDARRWHLASDALLGTLTPVIVAAGTAMIATAEVTGALRGASTLMSPINILLASIPLALLAEASRRTDAQGVALLRKAGVLMVGFTLVWGALLWFLPDVLGRAVLGQTWAQAHPITPWTTVEFCGIAVWTICISILRVRQRTDVALTLRLIYSAATLVLALGVAALVGTAKSVEIALVGAVVLVVLVALPTVRRVRPA